MTAFLTITVSDDLITYFEENVWEQTEITYQVLSEAFVATGTAEDEKISFYQSMSSILFESQNFDSETFITALTVDFNIYQNMILLFFASASDLEKSQIATGLSALDYAEIVVDEETLITLIKALNTGDAKTSVVGRVLTEKIFCHIFYRCQ